jgi:hypothetical protein
VALQRAIQHGTLNRFCIDLGGTGAIFSGKHMASVVVQVGVRLKNGSRLVAISQIVAAFSQFSTGAPHPFDMENGMANVLTSVFLAADTAV